VRGDDRPIIVDYRVELSEGLAKSYGGKMMSSESPEKQERADEQQREKIGISNFALD
jgi:hypothetical protein